MSKSCERSLLFPGNRVTIDFSNGSGESIIVRAVDRHCFVGETRYGEIHLFYKAAIRAIRPYPGDWRNTIQEVHK